ncbi:hypothetical protein G5V59_27425 [Nocardioides sp. W3-2-3]|uniref:hypothetical protein n=1 Tax=Nocardioides convexus TaxID=2712224 RepID=UPI002418A1CC|nr:hypothetical protein [Nocardioides convexus]NHA02114.1 hypothetical protein [Nocardioides convexus]
MSTDPTTASTTDSPPWDINTNGESPDPPGRHPGPHHQPRRPGRGRRPHPLHPDRPLQPPPRHGQLPPDRHQRPLLHRRGHPMSGIDDFWAAIDAQARASPRARHHRRRGVHDPPTEPRTVLGERRRLLRRRRGRRDRLRRPRRSRLGKGLVQRLVPLVPALPGRRLHAHLRRGRPPQGQQQARLARAHPWGDSIWNRPYRRAPTTSAARRGLLEPQPAPPAQRAGHPAGQDQVDGATRPRARPSGPRLPSINHKVFFLPGLTIMCRGHLHATPRCAPGPACSALPDGR